MILHGDRHPSHDFAEGCRAIVVFIIPEFIIVIMALIAALGVVFYSYTRHLKRANTAWAWMVIPCLQTAWTYYFFILRNIPLVDRAALARLVFACFLFVISVITFTRGYKNFNELHN